MSLHIQGLSYRHANNEILFQNISFSVSTGEKCAITGNNGVGKSTLLSILSGNISPETGSISCEDTPYLIPQHFGQFNNMTVAEALGTAQKLKALAVILDGRGTDDDFILLNDDWDIQERLTEAFDRWDIGYISPEMSMGELSGGEKTKVFLSGMDIYHPTTVLMDEPTNHLDQKGRTLLYDFINRTKLTAIVVSHDRTLLNQLSAIYEMSSSGMRFYPMHYDAYKEVSDAEIAAKTARLQNQQKELAKAEKSARKTIERQLKHASRGEKHNAKKCIARIAMGNLRDKSESSTTRLNKIHQEKLQSMRQNTDDIRNSIPEQINMKINLSSASLTDSKLLAEAENITFRYTGRDELWEQAPLNFSLYSGERIRVQGDNGSGKSTLLKLLSGELHPTKGKLFRREPLNIIHLDQEYSCLEDELTIYEQLESRNSKKLEHELKIILNRFLFPASTWDKKCRHLSGGERMKLALCCLQVSEYAPDMIIADEPTNNIDIASMNILADTLNGYAGTLVIVSHDEYFVQAVGITRTVNL